jgi:hypothetical protein
MRGSMHVGGSERVARLIAALLAAAVFAPSFGARAGDLIDVIPNLYGKNGITLATQTHDAHFSTDSLSQLNELSNGISSGINVATVGASTSSFTFDVQQATFVRSTNSLGPTLAERADTIGTGKINGAFTYTRVDYTRFQGKNLDDINLTLSHEFEGGASFEADKIDIHIDNQLSQNQMLFYGKFGITSRWDVGLILPVVNTKLRVNSTATIRRFDQNDSESQRVHNFCLPGNIDPGSFPPGGACAPGATVSTLNDPSRTAVSADENKTEFGDLLLQTKYNFFREEGSWIPDMAALGAIRFDTGDPKNFSGAGNTGYQGYFIASKRYGMFTPNLNLGAEVTSSGGFTDVWRLIAGTEFTPANWVTFSADVLGQQSFNGNGVNDRIWSMGFGVKVNPWSTLALIGDFIIPLNEDRGLRADVIWTVGFEYTF